MDDLDLQIIRLLARDCRNPYGNIASIVGMSPNAVKERINKMVSNGVIRSFVLRINPAILGYEKESIIVLRDIDKRAKEQDIINKIHLLGDIRVYAKQLEGVSIFALAVRAGTEDKMGIFSDLLKPVKVESIFVSYRPLTIKIRNSDFEIMKCLLNDPRMQVKDITKETLLSSKTVARRLEKMRENHILVFYFDEPVFYAVNRLYRICSIDEY